ncbi:MAG: hypothetical protein KC619_35265, partial [Myxococcales bacterium]|nr:hypothetical protein [Myxococcales bacterium]
MISRGSSPVVPAPATLLALAQGFLLLALSAGPAAPIARAEAARSRVEPAPVTWVAQLDASPAPVHVAHLVEPSQASDPLAL